MSKMTCRLMRLVMGCRDEGWHMFDSSRAHLLTNVPMRMYTNVLLKSNGVFHMHGAIRNAACCWVCGDFCSGFGAGVLNATRVVTRGVGE
jgi:hypothetical protein